MDTNISNNYHYEANRPKLQWLIILVPVIGAFAIYTFIRIKNKARAQQQAYEEEAATSITISNRITTPIPVYHRQIYDRSNQRRIPLIRLSNTTNTTMFWHRFQNPTDTRRRTPTPPPVYSISSPPKYDEVIALENGNESPTQNLIS